MEGGRDGWMDRWIGGRGMKRWMGGGWMDGWMEDGVRDEGMDRAMDGCLDR